MARDNSPKERQQKQLERKQGRRASYDRILIVSEGSRTEPNYFSEIRAAYRLHTANVEVQPSELGTAPIQVVQYAQALFENGDPATRTSSGVRSRRSMPSSTATIMTAISTRCGWLSRWTASSGMTPSSRSFFRPLPRCPSFELWLLLHYEDIQAPLHRDEVMRRLKLHIPGYEKGAGKAFATTSEHLAAATQRAERLAARFTADTDPEPFYRHCGTGGAADHASQLTWQSGAPRTHVAILCCPPIKMRLRSFSLQRSCHFD